jgi:hypothetical protein
MAALRGVMAVTVAAVADVLLSIFTWYGGFEKKKCDSTDSKLLTAQSHDQLGRNVGKAATHKVSSWLAKSRQH